MEHVRIDLAHQPDFAVGELNVHPSTRELSRGDDRTVIEPRVMQVLVALHRTGGAVVSKDDLAHSCWEGRVVGEDAINRVISRLRKLSDGLAKDIFQVETVTRVGYRLRYADQIEPAVQTVPPMTSARRSVDRRTAIIGGGALVAGVAGAGLWWQQQRDDVPAELAQLFAQSEVALEYATLEQTAAAVAHLQKATRRFPKNASAWGRLAVAYRRQGLFNPLASGAMLLDRSEAAARRAIELDPQNTDGEVVLALKRGLWYHDHRQYDRICSAVFQRFPTHELANGARSIFLYETGRLTESVKISGAQVNGKRLTARASSHARKLWTVGRIDEAESLLDRLVDAWPHHFGLWRSRMTFLLFSGQADQAEAELMASREWAQRPEDLEEPDVNLAKAQARAILSRDDGDIESALTLFEPEISINPAKAEEAASFASFVGRLDEAFRFLELHYFAGDMAIQIRREFPARDFRPHSGKMTYALFEPPMQAARADARFGVLMERLGLEDYWRNSGITPDYRAV